MKHPSKWITSWVWTSRLALPLSPSFSSYPPAGPRCKASATPSTRHGYAPMLEWALPRPISGPTPPDNGMRWSKPTTGANATVYGASSNYRRTKRETGTSTWIPSRSSAGSTLPAAPSASGPPGRLAAARLAEPLLDRGQNMIASARAQKVTLASALPSTSLPIATMIIIPNANSLMR